MTPAIVLTAALATAPPVSCTLVDIDRFPTLKEANAAVEALNQAIKWTDQQVSKADNARDWLYWWDVKLKTIAARDIWKKLVYLRVPWEPPNDPYTLDDLKEFRRAVGEDVYRTGRMPSPPDLNKD